MDVHHPASRHLHHRGRCASRRHRPRGEPRTPLGVGKKVRGGAPPVTRARAARLDDRRRRSGRDGGPPHPGTVSSGPSASYARSATRRSTTPNRTTPELASLHLDQRALQAPPADAKSVDWAATERGRSSRGEGPLLPSRPRPVLPSERARPACATSTIVTQRANRQRGERPGARALTQLDL